MAYITSLVINALGGRHTHTHTYRQTDRHTHTHTNVQTKMVSRYQTCAWFNNLNVLLILRYGVYKIVMKHAMTVPDIQRFAAGSNWQYHYG